MEVTSETSDLRFGASLSQVSSTEIPSQLASSDSSIGYPNYSCQINQSRNLHHLHHHQKSIYPSGYRINIIKRRWVTMDPVEVYPVERWK